MNSVSYGFLCSLVATLIIVHQNDFYIARHLAAKLGTKLADLL